MIRKVPTKILFAFICLISLKGNSQSQYELLQPQYWVRNLNLIDVHSPNTTTYILLQGMDAPAAKPYLDVIKKYWTFNRYQLIDSTQLRKTELKYNYLLSMNYRAGDDKFSYIYLDFYTNNMEIAGIKLEVKTDVFWHYNTLFKTTTCNYDGYIYTWGPGYLKNYIQFIINHLTNNETVNGNRTYANKDRLPELKTHILYIPDYYDSVIHVFKGFTYTYTNTKNDIADIMSEYKFSYKVVPNAQLDKMILDSTDGIYYMIPARTDGKILRIVDSKNGDILYSIYDYLASGIKSRDMKKISTLIDSK
jgi:hypothetical protein